MRTAVIILAADKGIAMHSKLPNYLHQICGIPLINHVISAVQGIQLAHTTVIVPRGIGMEVKKIGKSFQIIQQAETGTFMESLLQAESSLEGKTDRVLFLQADMPLIQRETLVDIVTTQERNQGPLTLLVLPSKYESSQDGIKKITHEEARVMGACFSSEWLLHFTRHTNSITYWEEFLTAAVNSVIKGGLEVVGIPYREETEANKVETRRNLAAAEAAMRSKINREFMLAIAYRQVNEAVPATVFG